MTKCICIIFCMCEPQAPTVISDYCQNTQVFRPSRQDTADTLKQVAAHNARYRAACIPAEPK